MVLISRKTLPFVLLLVLCFFGCGSGTHSLTGTATYDDRPIESGTMSLIPIETQREAAGTTATITNGKFSIPAKVGIVPGIYRISVEAVDLTKAVPATYDGSETFAPLFPAYSMDHTFSAQGPYTLEIIVPKK